MYHGYSEWNNHNDRRSDCLRHNFGHVDYSSIYGSFTSCTPARIFFEKNMGIPTNARKPFGRTWIHFIVGTRPRSDANAASGDRPPTASGDREQDTPHWLQPFTEGVVEGESGSSGSAGERVPTTPPGHIIPVRLKLKQDSSIPFKNSQRYFFGCALNAVRSWTLDHVRLLKKYSSPKQLVNSTPNTQCASHLSALIVSSQRNLEMPWQNRSYISSTFFHDNQDFVRVMVSTRGTSRFGDGRRIIHPLQGRQK